MSVVIRMKKMGRKHRHFFRICATDPRNPRDGRVIEEIGTYDPLVPETDARVTFNDVRLQHWLGVGAKPSERVAVLIKKYGPTGTHKQAQAAARQKLAAPKAIPDPGAPKYVPAPKEQAAAQTEGHPAEETESPKPKSKKKKGGDAEAAATEAAAAKADKHETEEPSQSASETPLAPTTDP